MKYQQKGWLSRMGMILVIHYALTKANLQTQTYSANAAGFSVSYNQPYSLAYL